MNIVDSSCWLEYFAGTAVGDSVAQVQEEGVARGFHFFPFLKNSFNS